MSRNLYESWKVTVPPCDRDGVVIKRFTVTAQEARRSQTAQSQQRTDRAVLAGTYTRLTVDGALWMSDTPAECADHWPIDTRMARGAESVLLGGLGLGLIVQRAFHHGVQRVDVVERDARVIAAVEPHYQVMADESGAELYVHNADIHEWHPPRGQAWDLAWWDIWADINLADLKEITRLKRRFGHRVSWQGAWGQVERLDRRRRLKATKGTP